MLCHSRSIVWLKSDRGSNPGAPVIEGLRLTPLPFSYPICVAVWYDYQLRASKYNYNHTSCKGTILPKGSLRLTSYNKLLFHYGVWWKVAFLETKKFISLQKCNWMLYLQCSGIWRSLWLVQLVLTWCLLN